jgi:hypothetical protein
LSRPVIFGHSTFRRALDYPISQELCTRIDLYLERFRGRIPGADMHTAVWASNKQRPMSTVGIDKAVRRRTGKAFGFAVNLHRFRHAAASFWSIRDPVNVRGVKDLFGSSDVRHYRETLHHGPVASRRARARPSRRRSAKVTSSAPTHWHVRAQMGSRAPCFKADLEQARSTSPIHTSAATDEYSADSNRLSLPCHSRASSRA